MKSVEVTAVVIDALESEGAEYMLVGAYLNHWTEKHQTRALLLELQQSLPNLDDLNEI